MLSGRRMPSSSANFSAGMILPRAMPAISGMMASTSEMPWSRKNCWISFAMIGPSPLQPLARRRTEGTEQRARKIVAHCFPLGMPLHGERETRRVAHAERFDHAIGRAGFDDEAVGEPIDALPVQRIHANTIRAGEAAQHAAIFEDHVVCRSVLHVEGLRLIFPVIELALHLLELLIKSAGIGDVHFLKAAAD